MERIIFAALRLHNIQVPGIETPIVEAVITNIRHCDCFEALFKGHVQYDKNEVEQGFWTTEGRFLNRYEAMELALKTGQLAQPTDYKELYSEDLW